MKSFSLVCNVCGTVNQRSQTHCLACGQVLSTSNSSTALTSAPTVSALSSKLLKQRYRVIHVVGKGGMGTVYIGTDTQLGNRLVAIKEMSQSGLVLTERLEAAKNFQREAHLLAGLQHPNLPSIYDHFTEGQRWYLVMSFIKGQTLASYLDAQGGRLALQEVLDIGIALCSVLNYLHTYHPPIIFRDLKPSNIMRTVEGHIYLIDFGIARIFKFGQATDTAYRGSSGYAPPEQYGTAQTTPRSDIYSLGATLYHLLSGYDPAYTPFRLPPLQSLVPTAPPELITLITQMIEIDERKRPHSAELIKWKLQRLASGSVDITPPPLPAVPLLTPPSGPIKRKKKGLVIASSTAIAIAIIASITAYLLIGGNASANNINTPYGVVNAFCSAMNSQSPDYQAAYNQLSRNYQRAHSLLTFQEYLLGTTQCVIASTPNNDQAGVSLTMKCPPPPPNPNFPPPSDGGGGPPLRIVPVDLTLIKDGSAGWKIDTIYLVGHNCSPPPNGSQPPGGSQPPNGSPPPGGSQPPN